MNPRICTVKHNPPDSYGDCIRACIGTILDRDDVPHMFNPPTPDSWARLREWLKTIGKNIALFGVDDHVETMRENNPDVPYMLLCGIADGDHAVVCRGGEVIHDPAWWRTAITGPHSMGFYVIGIVGEMI